MPRTLPKMVALAGVAIRSASPAQRPESPCRIRAPLKRIPEWRENRDFRLWTYRRGLGGWAGGAGETPDESKGFAVGGRAGKGNLEVTARGDRKSTRLK